MKKKILLIYIINAIISGFYIIKGLFTVILVNIRKNSHSESLLEKFPTEMFNFNLTGILEFADKLSRTVMNIMNTLQLYVYGYTPLFIGILALAFSSIGVFLLTKKQTATTVGYYVTVIYSYMLLVLLTIMYILISRALHK